MLIRTIHRRVIVPIPYVEVSTQFDFIADPSLGPEVFVGVVPDKVGAFLLSIRRTPFEYAEVIEEKKEEKAVEKPVASSEEILTSTESVDDIPATPKVKNKKAK